MLQQFDFEAMRFLPEAIGQDHTLDTWEQQANRESIKNLVAIAPSITKDYKIERVVGSGTFSCVFRAVDRVADRRAAASANEPSSQGPRRSARISGKPCSSTPAQAPASPRLVAIKQIYTSAGIDRVMRELDALRNVRALKCEQLLNIISATRIGEQVLLIMPYHPHTDYGTFMFYYPLRDIAAYVRDLLRGCEALHSIGLIHRDIKPGNFCWNPITKTGVIVDFGLAQYEHELLEQSSPCFCLFQDEYVAGDDRAHFKKTFDQWDSCIPSGIAKFEHEAGRPRKSVERSGTRGYRAPEVLLHCTSQTTAIDVWSIGIVALCFILQRKVLFNAENDTEALLELAHLFGTDEMCWTGVQHGAHLDVRLPTLPKNRISWRHLFHSLSNVPWHRQPGSISPIGSAKRRFSANTAFTLSTHRQPLAVRPSNVIAQRMAESRKDKSANAQNVIEPSRVATRTTRSLATTDENEAATSRLPKRAKTTGWRADGMTVSDLELKWPWLEDDDEFRLHSCFDFLDHALDPNVNKRYTATELLDHPFIKSIDVSLDADAIEQLEKPGREPQPSDLIFTILDHAH